KSANASAVNFRFEVKNETPVVSNSGRSGGSPYNPQDLFDKAKEAALNEFRVEQWKKDVDLKIESLMKEISDIKLTIKELHDDDEDNDDDALDRISEVATKIPGIANGIKGISGLFKN
ncbi:MAG TPA: hypothetical protein VGN64_09195, partial [Dyadobacter sp.]|nr:hypothetical protein [Dyadobacter sp.]